MGFVTVTLVDIVTIDHLMDEITKDIVAHLIDIIAKDIVDLLKDIIVIIAKDIVDHLKDISKLADQEGNKNIDTWVKLTFLQSLKENISFSYYSAVIITISSFSLKVPIFLVNHSFFFF